MSYQVDVTLDGTTYTYPGGPMLPGYYVVRFPNGAYNFHNGDTSLDAGDPAQVARVKNIGPHHVKIVEDGVTLFDDDQPMCCWNAEWNFRPGAMATTMKKSIADVVTMRLLPPFGDPGVQPVNGAYITYKKSGDASNITKYFPTTGERGDIGMVTDVTAVGMLGGSLLGMINWGLAASSYPSRWRDSRTGLPPDVIQYPGMNAYDAPGYQGAPFGLPSPYIIKGPKRSDGYFVYADDWSPQNAHWCDASYAYAIMAECPIALKNVQEDATVNIGQSAEQFTASGARIQGGEYRGIAWGLGMLFKARAATGDAKARGYFVPSSHHDVPYWDAVLANNLEGYTLRSKQPAAVNFSLLTEMSTFGPWQHDYLLSSLSLAILTGRTDWLGLYIHCLKNLIDRYSGNSGYPPAFGSYYLDTYGNDGKVLANWTAIFDHFYQSEQDNAATAAAHGEVYTPGISTDQYTALKADQMNGGHQIISTGYILTARGVLSFADYLDKLGLAPVRATFPADFDAALKNIAILFKNYNYCEPRTCIVSDPAHKLATPPQMFEQDVPAPIPPPVTPPTNPPSGGIHMGNPFTVAPGASVHLPLTYDDGHGNPSQPPTGIAYDAQPQGVVSLAPDASGVQVTGVTAGTVTVTVHDDAGHTDTVSGTVTLPLAGAIHLNA